MAKLHEHVVEHDVLLVIVGRDLELHDLPVEEGVALRVATLLLEGDQGATLITICLRQAQNEPLEVFDGDLARRLLVEVRPDALEVLNRLLFYRDLRRLPEEGIDDDGDEEVEEDLRDDDLEEEVEGYRKTGTAALRPIGIIRVVTSLYNRIVVFDLFALVKDIARLGRIKHDRVPGFAGRASDQSQKRGTESLKVNMLVHFRGPI